MLRLFLTSLGLAALTAAGNTFSLDESEGPQAAGQVVLLHGLSRTFRSMEVMSQALRAADYTVCNVDYPSREHLIPELASDYVVPAIYACGLDASAPIHFVTHSMGGIIVRQISVAKDLPNVGRVVMLSPPNQGSEVIDAIGDNWLFQVLNGPAGTQLGTAARSTPNSLGPPEFQLGVITGNSTINPILSTIIPGEDDGKVAVKRAKVDGMQDFLVLPVSHPFIMRDEAVIRQSLYFLANGYFDHAQPE
jgi:triacylglycerol lipase